MTLISNLKSLIMIGVKETDSKDDARRTILLNKAILIMGIPGIPYAILFYLAENYELTILTISFLCAYSLSYFLNYFLFHNAAKFSMIFFTSLAVLVFSKILGPDAGIYLYFFSIAATTRVLFNPKNKVMNTISFTIPSMCFFIYTLVPFKSPFTINLAPIFLQGSFVLSAIISFTLIYFSLLYYTNALLTSEVSLLNTNKELTRAISEASERKLMLEKTSQQNAFATLTRGIAHEIKNPMAMILSGMELIIDNIDDKKQTLNFAELVKSNILRLKSITSTMLKYGSPVSENRTKENINEILENAVQVANAECKKRKITITTNISKSIPKISIEADALHQILLNLILNSIQAIDSKGEINISTLLSQKDHPLNTKTAIMLNIRDTGPGMDQETIEKIYDPFYSTKYGNVGLGLSIVLKTISDLGGVIDVQSDSKTFTEFNIYFPV
jgi:nitrogen-specific signal transduction histidine kinase